jgi:hypothetical protein
VACRIGVLIAFWSLVVASSAGALNMSAGNVVVEDLSAWGFINTTDGELLSWDGGTTDEMYEWFGYVANGDGIVRVDSNSFDLVGSFSETGGVATANLTLNSDGASDLGLSIGDLLITHTFTLVDSPSASDDEGLLFDVTITNDSGGDLDFNYYQYLDIDADGDFADDGATGDANGITVSDNTGAETHWVAGSGADRYEVNTYAKVRDKLDGWAKWKNLNNKGLDFGPNKDFTGAKQINVRDLQDNSYSFVRWRVVKGPEPGTVLLLGLGLGILGLAGRRRRFGQPTLQVK